MSIGEINQFAVGYTRCTAMHLTVPIRNGHYITAFINCNLQNNTIFQCLGIHATEATASEAQMGRRASVLTIKRAWSCTDAQALRAITAGGDPGCCASFEPQGDLACPTNVKAASAAKGQIPVLPEAYPFLSGLQPMARMGETQEGHRRRDVSGEGGVRY